MRDIFRTRRSRLTAAALAGVVALGGGTGIGLAANGGPVHAGPTATSGPVHAVTTATTGTGVSTGIAGPAVHALSASEHHTHQCQVDDVVTLTLKGTVNPDGGATQYHFTYGATAGHGHNTAVQTVSGSKGTTTVTATTGPVQGWQAFHFALVAQNSVAKITGADSTHRFEVFPCPLERTVHLPVTAATGTGGAVKLIFRAPSGDAGKTWNALVDVTSGSGTSLGESSVAVGKLTAGGARVVTVQLSSAGVAAVRKSGHLAAVVSVKAASTTNLNSVSRLKVTLHR